MFPPKGDFFITRHSNLSQVHVVLHLATDKDAVRDTGLIPIPVRVYDRMEV